MVGLSATTPDLLSLEWLSARHLNALQSLLADPRVAGPANLPVPFDGRRARLYLHTRRRLAAEGSAASFVALWDGRPCGGVTLHALCRSESRAEIGFWVGRAYWGRGIGAEIVARAVEIGVLGLRLRRIDARCRQDNAAARRLLSTLGFERTDRAAVLVPAPIINYRWYLGERHLIDLRAEKA